MRLNTNTAMLRVAMIALAAASTFACDDDDDAVVPDAGARDTGATDAVGSADAAALSDPDIAAVVSVANQAEIEQANIVVPKVQSPAVKAYAMMMINEHTMAQARSTALVQQAGIVPTPNATSQKLTAENNMIKLQLSNATAAQVDALYMQTQVAVHTEVLRVLENQLIPQADNAALKAELQTMRAAVAAHLTQARDILGNLGRDGGQVDGGTVDAATAG